MNEWSGRWCRGLDEATPAAFGINFPEPFGLFALEKNGQPWFRPWIRWEDRTFFMTQRVAMNRHVVTAVNPQIVLQKSWAINPTTKRGVYTRKRLVQQVVRIVGKRVHAPKRSVRDFECRAHSTTNFYIGAIAIPTAIRFVFNESTDNFSYAKNILE